MCTNIAFCFLFRCAPASTHDRTAIIDMALSLVSDTGNRLASDQVESFKKMDCIFV